MKKLFPVAAVAVLAMMFTSCKKDYTCTCTSTVAGTTTTVSGKTGKMSKKDAKAACEKGNVSTSFGSVTCKID